MGIPPPGGRTMVAFLAWTTSSPGDIRGKRYVRTSPAEMMIPAEFLR
jgi:hypothetical protein